jgi:hypothetical protein
LFKQTGSTPALKLSEMNDIGLKIQIKAEKERIIIMDKAIKTIFICLFTILISSNAMAMWSFDISDNDNNGSYDLSFLSDDGPVAIQSFSLGFGYDESELSLDSFVFNVPAGYISLGSVDNTTSGEITDLSALTFSGSISPGTLLATFTFDLISPSQVQDGMYDFYFMNWGDTAAGNFGATTTEILSMDDLLQAGNLTYGANVDKGSAVPLPSALLLLGSGLLGLVGIRRKKVN